MTISKWINMGSLLSQMAIQFPDKLGCQNKKKDFTFMQWDERSCRLGNALTAMGVGPGDRFGVLAFNRVAWMEIYAGCAKAGQVSVPLMFRLAAAAIDYIVNDSGCKAFICEKPFVEMIN